MKTSITAAILIAAAIVGWKFATPIPSSAPSAPVEALPTPAAEQTGRTPTPAISSALNPLDQPNSEDDDSPYEMVLGINVRKDRNCTVEVREITDLETGKNRRIYTCTPNSIADIDPYTTYSDEVLAGMAYGDPHAAEVLGLRKLVSTDPAVEAEGLKLLLRAVALSNSTHGIALAVNTRYSHVSTDDQIHLDTVSQLYVLGEISNTITPNSMTTDHYADLLLSGGLDEQAIEKLRQHSQEILSEMAGVQTEITGNTDIKEALEDA